MGAIKGAVRHMRGSGDATVAYCCEQYPASNVLGCVWNVIVAVAMVGAMHSGALPAVWHSGLADWECV